MKTKFLKSVAGFALLASAFAHAADPYPNKTITMIVPFAAGGPTDTVARFGCAIDDDIAETNSDR